MLGKVTHCTGQARLHGDRLSASLMIKVSDNVCGHTPLLQTALPTQCTSHGASCIR